MLKRALKMALELLLVNAIIRVIFWVLARRYFAMGLIAGIVTFLTRNWDRIVQRISAKLNAASAQAVAQVSETAPPSAKPVVAAGNSIVDAVGAFFGAIYDCTLAPIGHLFSWAYEMAMSLGNIGTLVFFTGVFCFLAVGNILSLEVAARVKETHGIKGAEED
jgi:hypothetical protein